MAKIRLGVLVSGGGSNLQAIIDNIEAGRLDAEVVVVISNEPDAFGLTRAANHHIPGVVINHRDFPDRDAFDLRLVEELQAHNVELVVLAGFMRLITKTLLDAFPMKVMNIHPALLPSFPGTHVWGDQTAHGVKMAGCTVHFVDAGTDTGPIIIQAAVPVLDDDDADALAARILKQEHRIFSQAIQYYADGRLKIEGRRVRCEGSAVDETMTIVNPPLTLYND